MDEFGLCMIALRPNSDGDSVKLQVYSCVPLSYVICKIAVVVAVGMDGL